MTDLVLPDPLREELKRPLGPLFKTMDAALAEVKKLRPPKVVAVGDVVTYELLKRNAPPDLSIIDGKAQRELFAPDKKYKVAQKEVRLENPAGRLTKGLRDAVGKALYDVRTRIFVYGEEDLAVLAVGESAPTGTVILYGQPNEGVVLVRVDAAFRKRVADILGRMERA